MKKMKITAFLAGALIVAFLFPAVLDSELSAQVKRTQRRSSALSSAEGNDGFVSPIRIAFGPDGVLLVTDSVLNKVVFVNAETNEVTGAFPVAGKPLGVAYARKRIYVGNATRSCVSVFNEDGTWREDITGRDLAPLSMPTDLAIDTSNNMLFVLDFEAKAVKVFALNGQERGTIPAASPDPVALTMPTAVAVDPVKMQVLVSDYGGTAPDGSTIRPRIQIFDYDGNLRNSISSYQSGGMMGGTYRFSRPQGLQADSQSQVVLTDCYSGEVLIIAPESGTVLKTLGGYGVEPGKMRLPLDLVVDDASKDIFVTNNLLKRIEIFRQGGVY